MHLSFKELGDGVVTGPSDSQGPLSTQAPAKISTLLVCGHQSPRCLHPVSPRVSPCCSSILFLGIEVICQAQDLFCCFCSLDSTMSNISECCLRGNLPRLSLQNCLKSMSSLFSFRLSAPLLPGKYPREKK